MKNRQFTPLEQDILQQIMLARRDVRGNRFLNTPIAQTDIGKILTAASWAPSVGYSQPWEFVIVNDQERKQQVIDSFNRVNSTAKNQFSTEKQRVYAQLKLEGIQEAPVNIAVFYRPSKLPVLGQSSMLETGRYSVVCAIQNMWLYARAMNIGLGWVSILEPAEMKSIFDAPDDAEFIAYLCLGYVNEFLEQPELEQLNWETRKPIKDSIFFESYS
ncbi:5,6-dimethylbenzimidazole synthase [Aliikangiella maris]|uniref:5,6-dimethylbenzimidazole synthase n=2 Tax=Aliikangiella maris TaxID=3162458 RepID=A0ABV3MST5_9GAMM